ncbi:MAG: lytic murein transglycosylase B [Gammaproteobacteria bacterium]|nr:lytic murein transglycosylase B [Gammaproteobacteria bacterium]
MSLSAMSQAFANYLENPEVEKYIAEISAEHKLGQAELKGLFKKISPQQSVLEKIARPAEKRLEWKDYRPIFLKQDRIEQGVEFMRQNAALLEKAEKQYGVPAEIITAIIGVETKYGRITGDHPVFSSVATLAFDYPPRSTFFRGELTEFLLFAREERFDPLTVKGSYAGAMGMAQFISSSYRRYAVDFDGDGKRDLFNSRADAIGSVANYFKAHKWIKGEAVTERVKISGDALQPLIRDDLKPSVGQQALTAKGVKLNGKSAGDVVVLSLQGSDGEEVWVGHHNFYVITRYNHSALYAMAVYQLSEAIKAAADA